MGSEDAAEVGGERAGLVGVGLAAQGVLDVAHPEGEVVVLAAEVGVVVDEVAAAVLLAQGPQAHHEDAPHQEQLHEAVLVLRRVLQETQWPTAPRAPAASAAADAAAPEIRHSRWRCFDLRSANCCCCCEGEGS